MRRRDFIKVIAGSVTAWPLAARAQLAALPVIGLLGSASPDLSADRLRPFRQGLSETGYVEGNNVVIEYRWAGRPKRSIACPRCRSGSSQGDRDCGAR
jgi:putative tryptophan/tyrosine transport system substrate-binding protein